LQHYFLTYKQLPDDPPKCEITHTYGCEEAKAVIQRSQLDYEKVYGNLEDVMSMTLVEAFTFGRQKQELLKDL